MNKKLSIIIVVAMVAGGIYFLQNGISRTPAVNPLGERVTVYLTPDCGCCAVYVKYLQNKGVEVEEVVVQSTREIREQYGIPIELSSCHTSVVAGYGIEGHVPLEVIEKLLIEKPDIQSISLPAMPPGTPGMPGPKKSDWIFYSIDKEGEVSEYLII
jgi:hypothetical protein